ncbi:MAG: hypothetical protein KKF77_01360 [Proteobacteria bacterium]|nr:hypothetical protein [Pseudomonadota bacterium]
MSECTTCHHYGPHMHGAAHDMPWPCIVCEGGEKYVQKGTKPPRKTLRDRCAQLEAENYLLRAKVGART